MLRMLSRNVSDTQYDLQPDPDPVPTPCRPRALVLILGQARAALCCTKRQRAMAITAGYRCGRAADRRRRHSHYDERSPEAGRRFVRNISPVLRQWKERRKTEGEATLEMPGCQVPDEHLCITRRSLFVGRATMSELIDLLRSQSA